MMEWTADDENWILLPVPIYPTPKEAFALILNCCLLPWKPPVNHLVEVKRIELSCPSFQFHPLPVRYVYIYSITSLPSWPQLGRVVSCNENRQDTVLQGEEEEEELNKTRTKRGYLLCLSCTPVNTSLRRLFGRVTVRCSTRRRRPTKDAHTERVVACDEEVERAGNVPFSLHPPAIRTIPTPPSIVNSVHHFPR